MQEKQFDLPIKKGTLLLLALFLLFFPKGGFMISGIPLTWGYILIALFALFSLNKKVFCVNLDRISCLVLMLPFQLLSLTSFALYPPENPGKVLAFTVSFFCLPYIFFLLFSRSIDEIDPSFLKKLIKAGVLFVSLYGLFLFFFKITTGEFFQIPLLTVNLADYGDIDTKCIYRGFGYKLISTFNNGNLYGICLLMLLPLFTVYQKKILPKILVKASLLLTLSRTVWAGLFIYELLFDLIVTKNKKAFFQKSLLSLLAILLATFAIALYYDLSLSFFLDKSLGGRTGYILKSLENPHFLPHIPFEDLRESIYPSVFEQFGLIGLIFFLIQITSPLLVKCINPKKLTLEQRAVFFGLMLYWLISTSDGAILLIPTMAIYWFLGSFLHSNHLFDSHSK